MSNWPGNVNVIQIALPLVKHFEGCKLEPYRDSAGIPTIGYGTIRYPDDTAVTMQDGAISQETADQLLCCEMGKKANLIAPMLQRKANPNQAAAMLSLTYNIGTGAFRSSTVLKAFNAGDISCAAEAFLMWDKATVDGQKVVIEGLLNRRNAELALFLTHHQA